VDKHLINQDRMDKNSHPVIKLVAYSLSMIFFIPAITVLGFMTLAGAQDEARFVIRAIAESSTGKSMEIAKDVADSNYALAERLGELNVTIQANQGLLIDHEQRLEILEALAIEYQTTHSH
jgi:hypothetical protein